MKKYAIFDQTTGQYTFYSGSREEVTAILAQKILEIQLKLSNNTLWISIDDAQGNKFSDALGNKLPDTFILRSELAQVVFEPINL